MKMDGKQDIDNLCRTCTIQLNEMFSVFDFVQIASVNSISISYILMECASVEIISDDSLPKNICSDCLSMAKQSYLFKQNCQKAQKRLINIVEKQDPNSHTSSQSEIVIKNDILDNIVDTDLNDRDKTNSGIEYLDTNFDQICGSSEQTTSELIIKDDFLDDDTNENLYDYEETNARIDNLDMGSDKMYYFDENMDSVESKNFIEIENSVIFEKLIDNSAFSNNISDNGEFSGIQFAPKREISTSDDAEHVRSKKSNTDKDKLMYLKQKDLYCCFCDTIYSNQSFIHHIKACKNKPEKYTIAQSLTCPICKKRISRRSALLAHRIKFHPEDLPNRAVGIEEYNCEEEICTDIGSKPITSKKTTSKKNKLLINHKYCNFCDRLVPHKKFTTHTKKCEKRPENCTEDDNMRCPICKQVFRSYNNLTRHRMVIHGDNIPDNFKENGFICEKCDRIFLWNSQYRRHLTICNNENWSKIAEFEKIDDEHRHNTTTSKLYCELCKIGFQNEEELNRHNTTHKEHKSPLSRMLLKKGKMLINLRQKGDYCCFCDTVFSIQYFKMHIRTCAKKPKKYTKADSLTCQICKKRTAKRRTLLTHRIVAHTQKFPNYVYIKNNHSEQEVVPVAGAKRSRYCNFCDCLIPHKIFARHVEKCEKRPENCSKDDYMRCPICNQVLWSYNTLVRHRMVVHDDKLPDNFKENALRCKYCGRIFLWHTQYSKHLMICKKNLPQVVEIKKNEETSKQDTTVVEIYCEICKIKFQSKEEFNNHNTIHEKLKSPSSSSTRLEIGEMYDNVELKRDYCSFCDTVLINHNFNLHFKICKEKPENCTAARSLTCHICKKRFPNRRALLTHRIASHIQKLPNRADIECNDSEKRVSMISSSEKNKYCNFCDCLVPHDNFVGHRETCEKRPENCSQDDFTRCPICKQVLSSHNTLTRHRMVVHGDNIPDNFKQNAFICEKCNRIFLWRIQYRRHLNVCNNEYWSISVKCEPMDEANEQDTTSKLYCELCKIKFQNEEEFDRHNTTHKEHKSPMPRVLLRKQKVFNNLKLNGDYCSFCDTVFSSEYFNHHIKTCTKKPESYTKVDSLTCPICKKRTFGRRTLLIHRIRSHQKKLPDYVNIKNEEHPNNTSINSRYCNFCDSFMNYKRFPAHLKKCEKMPENCTKEDYLRCPICKILVPKSRYMTKHRVTVHPDNLPNNYSENVLECKNCDQKYFRYSNYCTHLKICKGGSGLFEVVNFKEIQNKTEKDSVDVFKMYCKLCKISFMDEESFNQHTEKHGNRKVYLCKICGKIYKTYLLIMIHVQIHGKREKHLCSVCGKEFKCLMSVETHMRVHTGEKPFACDKCEMRFITKAMLKNHMISHSDKRNYKCWICDVTFKRSGRLYEHMRHHKETNEGKQHTCDICMRTFSSTVKLKNHTKIHQRRSRVNLCTRCDRTFSSSHALKVHTRLHTGEKPYVCPICKEGFPQGVSLKSHMKQHKTGRIKKSHQKRLKGQKCSKNEKV